MKKPDFWEIKDRAYRALKKMKPTDSKVLRKFNQDTLASPIFVLPYDDEKWSSTIGISRLSQARPPICPMLIFDQNLPNNNWLLIQDGSPYFGDEFERSHLVSVIGRLNGGLGLTSQAGMLYDEQHSRWAITESPMYEAKHFNVDLEPVGQLFLRQLTLINDSDQNKSDRPIGRPKSFRLAKWQKNGWSYEIIELGEKKERSPDLGGSHASPRWHVRRGHFRTLSEGRRIWIDQCEVGDKKIGGIIKDYTISTGASESA